MKNTLNPCGCDGGGGGIIITTSNVTYNGPDTPCIPMTNGENLTAVLQAIDAQFCALGNDLSNYYTKPEIDAILQDYAKTEQLLISGDVDGNDIVLNNGLGEAFRFDASPFLAQGTTLTFVNDTLSLLNDASVSLSSVQIPLSDYIPLSQKGQPGGVATLDGTGKVPLPQLPDSIVGGLKWKGLYDGTTITSDDPSIDGQPLPAASASNEGWYFISTADYINNGIQFHTGDWIISTGSAWEKVDNTDTVTSVFGRIGPILAVATDYNAFYLRFDTAAQNLTTTQKNNAVTNLGLDARYYPLNTNPAGYITAADIPAAQTLGLTTAAGEITISGGNAVTLRDIAVHPTGDFPDANLLPVTSGLLPYVVATATSNNYATPAGGGIKFMRGAGTNLGYFEFYKATNYDDTIYYRTAADGTNFNPWRKIVSDNALADYYTKTESDANYLLRSATINGFIPVVNAGSGVDLNNIGGANTFYTNIIGNPNTPATGPVLSLQASSKFGFQLSARAGTSGGNMDEWYYRSTYSDGSGTWFRGASREWVSSLPGLAPQTLSLGTGAGDIAISGGNNVSLKSVRPETYSGDRNSLTVGSGGLYPYFISASTGWPYINGGSLLSKTGAANTLGAFELWKSTLDDGKLMFNVGTTGTSWKGWETFASEEHVAANYVTVNTAQSITAPKTFSVPAGVRSITLGNHSWDYGFNSWPVASGSYANIGESTPPDDPGFAPKSITYALAVGNSFPTINNSFNLVETRKLWAGNPGAWQFIYPYVNNGDTPIYYRSASATGTGWNAIRAIASREWANGQFLPLAGGTLTGPLKINGGAVPLSLSGSGTGVANQAYINFFEIDGVTRQGYIGYGTTTSSDLSVSNEVSGNRLVLSETAGNNGLLFRVPGVGNKVIWHEGNFDATGVLTDITALEQDVLVINQDLAAMDLQEVTDIGATTTNPITIGDATATGEALNGNNAGIGLSWNDTLNKLDWGATVEHLGNTFLTVDMERPGLDGWYLGRIDLSGVNPSAFIGGSLTKHNMFMQATAVGAASIPSLFMGEDVQGIGVHGISLTTQGGATNVSLLMQAKSASDGNAPIVFRDDAEEIGAVYAGDYEANFVPRSLVTKQYVDARISTSTEAEITGTVIDFDAARFQYRSINANTTFTITNNANGKIVELAIKNTAATFSTITMTGVQMRGGWPSSPEADVTVYMRLTQINGIVYGDAWAPPPF